MKTAAIAALLALSACAGVTEEQASARIADAQQWYATQDATVPAVKTPPLVSIGDPGRDTADSISAVAGAAYGFSGSTTIARTYACVPQFGASIRVSPLLNPASVEGATVLAHEAWHDIQCRQGRMPFYMTPDQIRQAEEEAYRWAARYIAALLQRP